MARLEQPIYSLAFSPDGQLLASALDDGTIQMWNIAFPDSDPIILSGHEGRVFSLAFSPHSQTLASSSADSTVRLWIPHLETLSNIACQSVRRNLSKDEWLQYIGEETYRVTCPNLLAPSNAAEEK